MKQQKTCLPDACYVKYLTAIKGKQKPPGGCHRHPAQQI